MDRYLLVKMGVRTFVNREGISAKKSFEKDFKVGDIVKGEAAKHLRNIADSTGKPFSMVSREINRQNPYVADRILEMRKFFNEDLGQAHFYGLDHVKAPRFGGTNAIENLHFTMEGPHNALKPLDPTKTLSDIDVKNKSKMEADVHKLALQLVDNVSSGNIDKATELSEQIRQITDSFANTYSKTDFHIGEPYVPVKTGDNSAEFIKYTDYLKLTPKLKKIVTDLLPDQFNKPNAGISIEDQVDQVYNVYAEMFNLGGPISKEQMTQMGFYNKGGAVDATTVRPEISIEFGDEDSDLPFGYGKEENTEGGAVGGPTPVEPAPEPEKEYIGFDDVKDFLGDTMESIDEFTEGERYRLLPKIIAKGLKSPGDYADSVLSKVDQYNQTMGGAGGPLPEEDQVSKFAQAMANPVVAGAKVFDFITIPLQEGYENMFSDDDSIYLPGYGEIKADTKFKKAMAAGATVGLTALEVLALFSPATLVRLGGLSTQAIANVMKRHYGKILTGGLIAGYETKDPFIFGDEGLISMVKGFFDENKDVQDDVAADIEKEIVKGDQADPLNPGGPGLDYADGGMVGLPPEFTGEYAETKLAMGGDPGQFTNPTLSGLEEEIDIGDYLLDPAYESVEDLDNLFDITRSAEDAFQRDSGFSR